MPRPRLVKAKAEVNGAMEHNRKRYEARAMPKRTRPLGDPYVRMTEHERWYWDEVTETMPWVTASDRMLVRMVCMWMARIDENPDFGINATSTLAALLSKLGATPTDISKVRHVDEDKEETPEQRFFGT